MIVMFKNHNTNSTPISNISLGLLVIIYRGLLSVSELQ